jgi:hypothetical protein
MKEEERWEGKTERQLGLKWTDYLSHRALLSLDYGAVTKHRFFCANQKVLVILVCFLIPIVKVLFASCMIVQSND